MGPEETSITLKGPIGVHRLCRQMSNYGKPLYSKSVLSKVCVAQVLTIFVQLGHGQNKFCLHRIFPILIIKSAGEGVKLSRVIIKLNSAKTELSKRKQEKNKKTSTY